jgi:16S rRNA (adenine1518-N6/adenine1519-N6)-dimethyltransferase
VGCPILVELAKVVQQPERLVVTLQLEVAQRLLAVAGSEDYGILTLLVQLLYQPQGLFKIASSCFFPTPEVDSECVRLIRRTNLLLPSSDYAIFARMVKRGFSQRRKMMFKLLKTEWPPQDLEAAYADAGLLPAVRAEHVSLLQFVRLTQFLAKGTTTDHA